MSLTITITAKELERQAVAAFVGRPYKVFLVSDPEVTLDHTDTLTAWEALELASANGYAAVTGTIAAGSTNEDTGQYELPQITAVFTATGVGFNYETIIVSVDANSYPHTVMRHVDTQYLQSGQAVTYALNLVQGV